jgi:FixJ family two-component response regulator
MWVAALSQSSLIAIVDDDESIREATQGLLTAVGYTTEAFQSAEDFLASGRLSDVACLITDLQLGGMSGLQLQRHLGSSGFTAPIIVMTAFPDDGRRALAAGALCVLDKPFIKDDLLSRIRSVLQSGGRKP